MGNVAIRAEGLGKRYRLGQAASETLRDAVWHRFRSIGRRRARDHIWALKDVNFEVERGTSFGIIGQNGAGKSTLLKILSRVTSPSAGFAELDGTVGSLLEVGTGFHPELTGRENIILSGAILGMSRREIKTKFDEIVAFAEVERFIDTPVKRYSSGMLVRLGFAVAAHLDTEILLIDEVLSVGDAAFQRRCLGKARDVTEQGRTVCLVTHQLGLASSLCDQAILLDQGHITDEGPASEVVDRYVQAIDTTQVDQIESRFPLEPDKDAQILSAKVRPSDTKTSRFDVFDPLEIDVSYELRVPLDGVVVHLVARRNDDILFVSFDADDNPERLTRREPGRYRASVRLPGPLKPGNYTLELAVWRLRVGGVDVRPDALSFHVEALSFDPSHRSYASDRLGSMAAHLHWVTERVGPPGSSAS